MRDAGVDELAPDAKSTRARLDEEQAQPADLVAVLHQEHRADRSGAARRDPAPLGSRIVVADEFCADFRNQRLEFLVPTELLAVDDRMPLHDPAHVAEPMLSKDDALGIGSLRLGVGEKHAHASHG